MSAPGRVCAVVPAGAVDGHAPLPGAGWRRAVRAAAVGLAIALAGPAAHAGRACEEQPLQAAAVQQGMALAQATARALEGSGARVVLLARAGQDLGKYGLRWSHLGFAYREEGAGGRSVWRVVHKLNHCGTAQAQLYRQGLGEFFLDRPHRYEAAYAVLAPQLQEQLLPLLRDNRRVVRMHQAPYSMVAYPWATRYQQSNQWALETLAMAAAGATDRGQAQTWLARQAYEPTTLRLSAFTRLGARATAANVAFDDHPSDKRFSDRIETVTVDSMFQWLVRAGLGATPVTVS